VRVIEKMFTESNYRLIDDSLLLTTSVEYAGLCWLHIHHFSDGDIPLHSVTTIKIQRRQDQQILLMCQKVLNCQLCNRKIQELHWSLMSN
jgi:hypothetical protein